MPPRRTTPQGYEKARQLRKELTPAERKLWAVLRGDKLGVSFRRQHAIGPYIADFCCVKKKLIIELDGVSIWNKKCTMKKEPNISNRKATRLSAFGTMT